MTAKTLEELADTFALFDNWEDRYQYLIDLGGRLEPLEPEYRNDDYLVKGCTSQVWLVPETGGGDSGEKRFRFKADSNAQIVKGLIYILIIAYQDKTPEDIASVNIESWFDRLGLSGHLSPNRRNGFFAMVETIKTQSAA